MKVQLVATGAALALCGAVLFAPAAGASPAGTDPPENCPDGNMCVYSDGGFGGNEISSPPSIPIDIPGNFGDVRSFYNNSSVRWCAHFGPAAGGGEYQVDPYTGVGRSFYDIVRAAADGSC